MALLILLVLTDLVSAYNGHGEREESVEAQARQVDVAYQRALRLMTQLVALAEEYLNREVDVMERVTALRAGLVQAEDGTLEQKDAFTQEVLTFVALVGNRVEAYPELQSAQLYQDTMTEITNSENKIAMEKVRYNDRVREYNAQLRRCCLPMLTANLFGFEAAGYLGMDAVVGS